jgi:DNA-binding NtrC family response regulator
MARQNPTPLTVLVIDDETLLRWSIGESLTAAGYQVRVAGTGAEARAELERCAAAALVVVLDLHLPDVTDLGLLLHIHSRRPDAPLIVMSTSERDESPCRAASSGVTAFLRKPFDLAVLARLIQEAWPDHAG